MTFATDPRIVAEQAGIVAAAWSPPGAPPSWRLTAAQFEALRDDRELLGIAATIPAERLPPLLFEAAASFLILTHEPRPLRDWFPRVGEAQAPLDPDFQREYRAFCLDHRERLLELCALHRYQMNEVGRCADIVPALAPTVSEGRDNVLVDIGTGAGLALHLDRYRYIFHEAGAAKSSVLGTPVPPSLVERNRRDGVFGVVGRLTYRGGRPSAALLGLAHPGAAWLEWLVPRGL